MKTNNTRTSRATSRLTQLAHSFGEWRRRIRSRDELRGLSDHSLHDIGLSRIDAERESSKRFWMT